MNDDDQFEEFLLPVEGVERIKKDEMISGGVLPVDSPTRRFTTMLSNHNSLVKVPESPDMKIARKRLGNLLSTIKQHPYDMQGIMSDEYLMTEELERKNTTKNPPGRPRKVIKDDEPMTLAKAMEDGDFANKRILFELRGKSFELIAGHAETSYPLSRAWVTGHVNRDPPFLNTLRTEFAQNLSVDYLAGRDIHKMPRPTEAAEELPIAPLQTDQVDLSIEPAKVGLLKIEYVRHWKHVKRTWVNHQRKKNARFTKNIQLLEKIFSPPDLGEDL